MNIGFLDTVYLDVRKAFDFIPYQHLLLKLKGYSIDGELLRWNDNFLANCQQIVITNGHASEWRTVLSGAPQSTVLGPYCLSFV